MKEAHRKKKSSISYTLKVFAKRRCCNERKIYNTQKREKKYETPVKQQKRLLSENQPCVSQMFERCESRRGLARKISIQRV